MTGNGQVGASWELDCSSGVAVLFDPSGRVFPVPGRCKKMGQCASCRRWAWARQEKHIFETQTIDGGEWSYIGEDVTEKEWGYARQRIQRLKQRGEGVGWVWVSAPDSTRTVLATADLTQPRGNGFKRGRMQRVALVDGLSTLGLAYQHANAVKRWPCDEWRVPTRYISLGFGGEKRMTRAMDNAFPGGDTWNYDENRPMTLTEVQECFAATLAEIDARWAVNVLK